MSAPANRHQVTIVLLVTALYVVIAAIVAQVGGNTEFIFYIVVMVVLGSAIVAVHRSVGISAGLLWCLSVWGLLHMGGGLLTLPEGWAVDGPPRVLYNWWLIPGRLKYDQVVHAYGFGITTWLCWQALSAGIRHGFGRDPEPTLGLLTLCAAAGMGFGALNEVVEFAATLNMEETNVGGYVNTGWDLVANLVGVIVAALIIRWWPRRAPDASSGSPLG